MRTYLFAFLLSVVCALVITPLVRRWAIAMGAMDEPGERRVHTTPIPRMGGLAVAAAFSVPLIGLMIYENKISVAFYQNRSMVLGLAIGTLLMLTVGIYDDIRGARPVLKLLVQILAAVVCFKLGYQITLLTNPLSGGSFDLGWLSFPITVLWFVGLINAINLIDGIDGLASGVAFFACVTLFIISLTTGDIVNALLVAALGGAIVGFLFFNFNPATVFLGDTGSLFLGFILAATSVAGSKKGYAALSILVPAMALGVPILDTSLAVLRRMLTGKSLMSADRHHIHHRLLQRGLSQKQVVLALYGLCALLASVSLATVYLRNRLILGIILFALGGFLLFSMRYLGYVAHIKDERRSVFMQELFGSISARTDQLAAFQRALAECRSLEGVWRTLLELCEPFQLIGLRLELVPGAMGGLEPEGPRLLETGLTPSALQDATTLTLPLGTGDAPFGWLVVCWQPDAGPGHAALYRLFFELVRTELEHALTELTRVAPPVLEAGLARRSMG